MDEPAGPARSGVPAALPDGVPAAIRRPVPYAVSTVLDPTVATAPDRDAVVARSGRLSYADLDRAGNQAARALFALGVRAGDRVGVTLPNDLDVVVAFHAVMRLGAVWVGVNRSLALPEQRFILDDAGARILLADDQRASEHRALVTELDELERVVIVDPCADGSEWAARLDAQPTDPLDVTVDPFAPAGIAYTSGTTGFPKGVVHSQHNLMLMAAGTVSSRGYGPDLRKGDCMALTILNMQALATVLVAQAGGTCVIMDRMDAVGIAAWIRAERVTVWNGVPAILHSMTTDPSIVPDDLATLLEVWTGGGDCPAAVRDGFTAKFTKSPRATYGLTEAPALVTIDDPVGEHVGGGSGLPLPQVTVSIRDPDGRDLPAGETGEICVGPSSRGPWAGLYRPMLGYHGRPDATRDALAGGVLHTGDLGYLDADGVLHVRDRKNLMIVRGGSNVYPAEVERVLHEVPGVAACAVLGLADDRLGERVVAAVEPEPGVSVSTDALTEHCRQSLARYKVPERFVMVEAFTRNAMGKIDRTALPALFTP
ncbi:MAG: AMP-dependent synthetase and ligase [Actinomycetia bacterium]|nr:AMP-dependent synthetase and ligase [Actinomycetes bacterium]